MATRRQLLAAVRKDPDALRDAPASARADREVVLAAVTKNGGALAYASEEMQDDREVVLVAVARDGCALKYASAALRADREVVLAAVAQDGGALAYASLAAAAQDGGALQYASAALRADPVVVAAAFESNATEAAKHAPPDVLVRFPLLRAADPKASPEIVRAAIAASRAALAREPVDLVGVERWTEVAAAVARRLPEDLAHEVEAAIVAPLHRPGGAYAAELERAHERMEAGC
jgi:hypothetical protein